jgi:hypothetical protein
MVNDLPQRDQLDIYNQLQEEIALEESKRDQTEI